MIQRIQSIYLFLIVLTVSIYFWVNPVIYAVSGVSDWTKGAEGTIEVSIFKMEAKTGNEVAFSVLNSYLVYVFSAVSLLALAAIFMFKNRKMQLLLCGFNYLFMAISAFLVYLYIADADKRMAVPSASEMNYLVFGFLLLFLWNFLATRGIMKDEKLIRSMDRLR